MKHINTHQSPPIGTIALVVVSAYIAAQMLANIASNKMGMFFGLSIDMGTFIYPITFTLRDLVHKQVGKKRARIVILIAGIVNAVMAAYIYFVAIYPNDPSWPYQKEFAQIFAFNIRIVIGSIVAQVVSELLDTEAYHLFVTHVTRRFQWLRVLVSNSVSVPIDTILFALIAFAPLGFIGIGEGYDWGTVWGVFTSNIIIKFAVTVASILSIYLVPEKKESCN